MELDVAKKLINKYTQGHADFIAHAMTAERYYAVRNDIMFRPPKHQTLPDGIVSDGTPLRKADNKIPFSFYKLLVDQKASYMFTAPPLFDVGNDADNKIIAEGLGDAYARNMKNLCVNASNAGVAWLHYWSDESGFRYAVVPSTQIIPVWSHNLDRELLAVLRVYREFDDAGDEWDVYEYWTDRECSAFRKRAADDVMTGLCTCPMFTDFYVAGAAADENILIHDYGRVPFIPFFNNGGHSSDLDAVKHLIDVYDKTFSGFVDDLEDIQEVILVLTNYGGQDLKSLMDDLKYYKAISLDSAGDGDRSGLSTLSIEIPVEARDKLLEITRKAIFDMGQGVDPQQQGLTHTSGEAMKFLYALLELKAGLTETEFKLSLNRLVRAIMQHAGRTVKNITQTWTRTSIRNDSELAEMCAKSVGIISNKTILKNHPFVENAEEEQKQIEKEDAARADDGYPGLGEGGEEDV